ncbi:MAG: glutathione peroxidase [Flavobacteriales bacterium]|nr:glutathione peroxidase [Flavobacteriales bacterium]
MRPFILFIFSLFIMNSAYSQSFYELSIPSIENKEIKMSDFKGKNILIVNVASYCGYTSQYADLQKLSQKYANKLVVLGVPCNQFGAQEPANEKEIITFCESKFDVTFPMTKKVDVKGKNQHPLYAWLTNKEQNGLDNFEVSWNFNKFLINGDGELIAYFKSGVNPLDEQIIERLK